MKSKLINDGPQKTYVLVLDKGDEAVGSIEGLPARTALPPLGSLASARSATWFWDSSTGR